MFVQAYQANALLKPPDLAKLIALAKQRTGADDGAVELHPNCDMEPDLDGDILMDSCAVAAKDVCRSNSENGTTQQAASQQSRAVTGGAEGSKQSPRHCFN